MCGKNGNCAAKYERKTRLAAARTDRPPSNQSPNDLRLKQILLDHIQELIGVRCNFDEFYSDRELRGLWKQTYKTNYVMVTRCYRCIIIGSRSKGGYLQVGNLIGICIYVCSQNECEIPCWKTLALPSHEKPSRNKNEPLQRFTSLIKQITICM